LLNGSFIDGKVIKDTKDAISYTLAGNDLINSIQKKDIDLIKFENGKIEDLTLAQKDDEYAITNENKLFDSRKNTDEFKNYINSIARETTASILKNIPGKIDNASYNIYFDLITFDAKNEEIDVPIKILYEKYLAINNGFVQATIKILHDGKRKIQITNSGLN
jgi:hypothetical protein